MLLQVRNLDLSSADEVLSDAILKSLQKGIGPFGKPKGNLGNLTPPGPPRLVAFWKGNGTPYFREINLARYLGRMGSQDFNMWLVNICISCKSPKDWIVGTPSKWANSMAYAW